MKLVSRLMHISERWVPWMMVLIVFAIPFGPSLFNIYLWFTIALLLIHRNTRTDLLRILVQPWCLWGIAFFCVVLLGCLQGSAHAFEKGIEVQKYVKMLVLPFLVVGFFNPLARRWGLYAFLLAMFIVCILSILKNFGIIDFRGSDPEVVFYNHIITGLMMSFAVYLSLFFAAQNRKRGRLLFISIFLILSYQMLFINTSRTGFVLYCLWLFYFIGQCVLRSGIKMDLAKSILKTAILCSVLFSILFAFSPNLHQGYQRAVDNMHSYEMGRKDTPIGYRLQFHDFALKLFLIHPWIGNGTGSYAHLYRVEQPVPSWPSSRNSSHSMYDPHSQYWLVAAEFGGVGLLIFLGFFALLWKACWQSSLSNRLISMGLIGSFMLGSLTDCLLFNGSAGYFFMVLIAIPLGDAMSIHVQPKECDNAHNISIK